MGSSNINTLLYELVHLFPNAGIINREAIWGRGQHLWPSFFKKLYFEEVLSNN